MPVLVCYDKGSKHVTDQQKQFTHKKIGLAVVKYEE
jgi:hypothetical protein